MQTIKQIAWCVGFILTVCAVTVGLLALGAYLDASTQQETDKVLTCSPKGKGFYNCKAEYI